MTPEEEELVCAWSDYRRDYGADSRDYKVFAAGWKAAREGDQTGVLR